MNIKTVLKSSVAAAALVAVAAPAADAAIKNGNKNTLAITGYVARAMFNADNGFDDHVFSTSGATSRTRVRWIANGTLNENVTAGATIEMDIPLADGGAANATFGTDGQESTTDTSWAIRHEYVWVAHKKLGKIRLGHTDPGGNGAAEKRFAKTSPIDNTDVKNIAAAVQFIDNKSRSTVTANTFLTNFDGVSRTSLIRYETPSFAGFGIALSHDNSGQTETGLSYSGKFSSVSVAAAIAYSNRSAGSTTIDDEVFGSVGLLHDSGINLHVGYAERNLKTNSATRSDPSMLSLMLGYNAKIFGTGETAFAVSYNKTSDFGAENDKGTAWGITAVQYFDPIGANVGAFYKNYDADRTNQNYDSIDVFGVQAVLNF